MPEIVLPGVKLEHLKRAIRFMYTGKLKVTTEELNSNYLVWNVKKIITEILILDAKLDFNLNLQAPPDESTADQNPHNDPDCTGDASGDGFNAHQPHGGGNSQSESSSDRTWGATKTGGYRQHAVHPETGDSNPVEPEEAFNAAPNSEENEQAAGDSDDPGSRKRSISENSDIEILETPARVTPDIIDLLDSDPEDHADDSQDYLEADDGGGSFRFRDSVIVNENAEDDTVRLDKMVIPEAPKLIPKKYDPVEETADKPKKVRE